MKFTLTGFVIFVSIVLGQVSLAQNYPVKPVRLIAPSSPGGPVDVIARAVAQGYAETLGQQIVIDNRAGAAGLIGAELVAKAPPDGYTLLFGFAGPLVIVPHLNATPVPYDTQKDFAPVSQAAAAPYILLVSPSLPVASVKELIAFARSQPGKLAYGSGGTGSGIHLAGELFNISTGIQLVHVPYKGAAPALTALLAGEVSLMFNVLPPALPHVKSGRVRALAVGGDKRTPLLPELPTIAESGLKFNTTGFYGVLAPRGTPHPVIARLHGELVRALATSAMKERLSAQGVDAVGSSPEQFAGFIAEEWAKWGKVIAAAGLKGKG